MSNGTNIEVPGCPSAACYLSVTGMNVIHREKALKVDSWSWSTWNNYTDPLLKPGHPLTFWPGISKPSRVQSLTPGEISKAVELGRVSCGGYTKSTHRTNKLKRLDTYSRHCCIFKWKYLICSLQNFNGKVLLTIKSAEAFLWGWVGINFRF